MNKLFWQSKSFWTGIAGIITSIGLLVSGEATVQTFIVESIPAVMGILGIIFRWNVEQPLGFSKN
jgi:hypothetical protein